jgi:hypothetical protein
MKRFLFLLCICSFFLAQSQIKYEFDYALEYELTTDKDPSEVDRLIYLTNSKDNSYLLVLRELDSLVYSIYFRDNNLFTLITEISKSNFKIADIINNDCNGVASWDGKRQKKYTKPYVFKSNTDTILNKKQLSLYKIEALPKSRGVKDKSAYNYYVIDETANHLPFFEPPLNYELWLRDKPFTNGIFEEFGSYDKKHGLRKYKLVGVKKIDKAFQIPEDCNQLN